MEKFSLSFLLHGELKIFGGCDVVNMVRNTDLFETEGVVRVYANVQVLIALLFLP
jgi:hypothetical protein